ncbi:MAG: fibronectin type III domain-containing protein [Armatimonadota bacterium]|nr:fibronectin type III domain-containing protein [Armatimonadota bacterium]
MQMIWSRRTCAGAFLSILLMFLIPAQVTGYVAAQSPPPFEAVIGTLNSKETGPPGTAFMFVLRQTQPPPMGGIVITVRGPSAWNQGAPLELRSRQFGLAGDWFWFSWMDRVAAVTGDYVVEAAIDGTTRRVRTSVDATKLLQRPRDITLESAGRTEVRVSWAVVPEAVTYYALLTRIDTGGFWTGVTGWYTKGTSVTFPALNLRPGLEHLVELVAITADITSITPPPRIPDELRVSWSTSPRFRVTSAGVLRTRHLQADGLRTGNRADTTLN